MAVHVGGRGPGHLSRVTGTGGGGSAPASPALKFNVASNSQYIPIVAF